MRARAMEATLALGAICVYMLNACFTRPAEGFGWESLIETACQQVLEDSDDEDEDAPTIPILYDSGTYFICDIVFNPHSTRGFFRLPLQRTFDKKSMTRIYQAHSMSEIKSSFSWIMVPFSRSRPNAERTNNRNRRTRDVNNIREPDRQPLRLNTEIVGVRFKPPVRLAGRDVELHISNGGDEQDLHGEEDDEERDLTADQRAANIYEQLLLDIVQEAPNKKSRQEGSYLSIPAEMREELARPALLQNIALPFYQVQYCVCTKEQWKMHFGRFFPATAEDATKAAGRQNFKKCTYLNRYITLAGQVGNKYLPRIRRALEKEFNTLAWVPFTQSDRMWVTKPMPGRAWKTLPAGRPGGPAIAINPLFQRKRVTLRTFARPDESDEDEASSEAED